MTRPKPGFHVVLDTGAILALAALACAHAVGAQVPTLDEAQQHFYSGRYEAASATALAVRASDPGNLASYELRTSALHFQIRRAMGNAEDREKAFKACAACPALLEVFLEEFAQGRAAAKLRLETTPNEESSLFFLGKIDLNYIWLRLSTLGERTGWGEYWEARRSLDAVLKANPEHVRAQVARAWIDYIVDTRVTRGFKWVLGGGNKKKALVTVRAAAASATDPFVRAEAAFGLWDLEVKERNIEAALVVAKQLAGEYPDNQELAKFIATKGTGR